MGAGCGGGAFVVVLFCVFFVKKVLIFFSYFSTKTYMLWYSLEVPHRDTSNEYSQHILLCLVFYIPFYLFSSYQEDGKVILKGSMQ